LGRNPKAVPEPQLEHLAHIPQGTSEVSEKKTRSGVPLGSSTVRLALADVLPRERDFSI
jgi:hypothetical protein